MTVPNHKNRSLFRLVQWDKNFIRLDFVQKAVADCQFVSSKEFFRGLSNSLGLQSGIVRRSRYRNFLLVTRYFLKVWKVNVSESHALKMAEGIADKMEIFGEDFILDHEYFTKLLRRNGVII